MKILVMGSGVIGVTSAWYLMKAGHEVTVVDRQPSAAEETSAGNAGQISPGYATPWAAPGILLKAIKWMLQKHAPLAIRPDGSLFQLLWMWQMLKNCNAADYAKNKVRMLRISEYSRDCLLELRQQTQISYHDRQAGTLQLFRTHEQVDHAADDIRILKEANIDYELLTPHELIRYEPALADVVAKLTGGLRLPNDETGDCQMFTKQLADMAQTAGVTFNYNCHVDRLLTENGHISGIQCSHGVITADRYIVACGSYSVPLLKGLIAMPVYPVKGYSLTIPITHADCAPVSTILDETYKVAVTRFDDRIRVGGMAELVGFNQKLKNARRETLEMVVSDLYPRGGDIAHATFWTGLRAMTPDGTPIIGATPVDNLYLNTGHGTLGWTMACGAGRLLADIISGNSTEIDPGDLSLIRYRR